MTTVSTLVLCTLIGQVNGDVSNGSAIPVPQGSARRSLDAPATPAARFGTPTLAEPSVAESNTPSQPRSLFTPPQASDLRVSGGNTNPPNSSFQAQGNFNGTNPNSNAGFAPRTHNQTNAALASAEQDVVTTAAMRLIRQAFPSPEDVGSESRQLTLQELIAATPDRARRVAAIQTYWEASTLLADWQFTAEEHAIIRQVNAPRDSAQQAALQAAVTAAQARLAEAQMSAGSARSALSEVVPSSTTDDRLPLPVDTPLAGEYNTHFETLFAARVAPPGLRRIHHTLPLRQDLVEARAAAVFAAAESVEQQLAGYQSGRASLGDLFRALDNLRTQRGAFLGALRDYNLDIAEYALGTSQPNDTPEKIVTMMIKTPVRAASANAESRSVLVAPAGATAPIEGGVNVQPPPLSPQGNSATQLPPPLPPVSNPAVIRPSSGTPATSIIPSAPPVEPNSPRVADQSSAEAAISRPTTERVLGTLRDVTTSPPASSFQPVGSGTNQPVAAPPSSRFGQPSPPFTPPSVGGQTRFGAQIRSDESGAATQNRAGAETPTLAVPPAEAPAVEPPRP